MPEEFCWDCFWWFRNSIILVKGINSCSKVQSIISWTKKKSDVELKTFHSVGISCNYVTEKSGNRWQISLNQPEP